MYCLECKTEKLVTDFIKNQEICFKCMYRIKTQNIKKLKIKPVLYCKMCNSVISRDEKAKKKQRNVFCSRRCAEKGQKENIRNHWTKQLKSRY